MVDKLPSVLFATSEAHPLIKTGGLADVAHGLPAALKRLGVDVRIVMPAYPQAVERAGPVRSVGELNLPGVTFEARLLEGRLPQDNGVPVYLVDIPEYFLRAGNPYLATDGRDWPDNAERYAALSKATVEVAMDRAGLGWQPKVVHCNDWQTGLVPAFLTLETARPATVFTIHNLAYQGQFSRKVFERLDLAPWWWSHDALEFHGNISFIKGGLVYADMISTVSPTYAKEILTPAFGYGLEGLLLHRKTRLRGILNGVDYDHWSPEKDELIPERFSQRHLEGKKVNKAALQERFGLPVDTDVPLLGLVGRLVEQKGFDLVLTALPWLFRHNVQLAIVGSGEHALEDAIKRAARAHPDQLAAHIGYSEELAHLVEAGADMFLMPSRFEPCGLNQIYSLRYGTIPIVHATGGLADSVVDASEQALEDQTATGFQFRPAAPQAMLTALDRALALFQEKPRWQQLMAVAMDQDFSWEKSARDYLALYRKAGRYAS